MLGAIAGDIIGSRFEGHPRPPPDFALFHPECRFTDDSVCTLAIADALLEDFGDELAPQRALAGGGFDVSAAGTVPPALAAALHADDWECAVRTAVRLGGDTDTLACIAGAVAEAIHGLPRDIADAARGYLTEDLRLVVERFEVARPAPLSEAR